MKITKKEIIWFCIMFLIGIIAIVLYSLQITSLYIIAPLFIVYMIILFIFCKEV